jgi:hypothetical protein
VTRRRAVSFAIVLTVIILVGLGVVAYVRANAEPAAARACVAAMEAITPGMVRAEAESCLAAAVAAGGERWEPEPGSVDVAPGTVQVVCRRFQPPDGPPFASEWLWLVSVRPSLLPHAPRGAFAMALFELQFAGDTVATAEANDCLTTSGPDPETCRAHVAAAQ